MIVVPVAFVTTEFAIRTRVASLPVDSNILPVDRVVVTELRTRQYVPSIEPSSDEVAVDGVVVEYTTLQEKFDMGTPSVVTTVLDPAGVVVTEDAMVCESVKGWVYGVAFVELMMVADPAHTAVATNRSMANTTRTLFILLPPFERMLLPLP